MSASRIALVLDPASVAAFKRHPLLKQFSTGRPKTRTVGRIHYDTRNLLLRSHGVILSLTHHSDGKIEYRVDREIGKSNPTKSYKHTIAANGHDGSVKVPKSVVKHLPAKIQALLGKEHGALLPIFGMQYVRDTWSLLLPGSKEVALNFDFGEVRRDAARSVICEINLNGKQDALAVMLSFAQQLQLSLPLRINTGGKTCLGFALYQKQTPPVVHTTRVALPKDSTLRQGMGAIIDSCLSQIHGNEQGLLFGDDPEHVHQMRVGIRRLRAAIGLLKPGARIDTSLAQELAWLAQELGAARDWDVLCATIANVASKFPNEIGLTRLRAAAMEVASERRRRAALAVGSARYTGLLLGISVWRYKFGCGVESDKSLKPGSKYWDKSLSKFASNLLARSRRSLEQQSSRLDEKNAQSLHRLRIAAKKTRYAHEFLASVAEHGADARYIKALAAVQDILGRINDATVAHALLRALEQTHTQLVSSIHRVSEFLDVDAARNMKKLKGAWKKLEKAEF